MDIRPILSSLRRHKTAAALLAIEIALTCAIICNALFLIQQRLSAIKAPSGVAEHQLLEVGVSGVGATADIDALTREDIAALRAIPGVASVTSINQLPFRRRGSWNTSLALTPDQEVPTLNAAQYMGSEDLVETLGLRITQGRDFNADEYVDFSAIGKTIDATTLSLPVLLSRAAADKLFPDGQALGKTVYMSTSPLRVIGIVERLPRPERS